MEGTKGSTTSSFTSDLFGSKGSSPSSSSSGIFGSMFPPPNKGISSVQSETVQSKQDSVIQTRSAKDGSSGTTNRSYEVAAPNKQQTNSFYQTEKVQPCHLSSSIYYGGQDVYSFPQSTQNSTYTTFNKDNGEDDSGSASRGNWWQGSLYY